jgi:dTDP-4-amino-4,6-dideoxygalactose transaminase
VGDDVKKGNESVEKIRDEMLIFGSPMMGDDEIAEVVEVVKSCWIGTGPRCNRFEQLFAEYVGVPHALATNSCTSSMHIALIASGVGPGDEVITTPMTFCATANVIVHCGATPVFADIDPETWNIDPAQVVAKITDRTKAILPVHFCGRSCNMDALGAIAKKHGLKVVADGAHAIETRWKDKPVALYGDACCYSFYATKNITTAEGGMLATSDPELARRAAVLRLHGLDADAWNRYADSKFRHYTCVEPGYKYNLSDMHAALGVVQLPRIEKWLKRREEIWAKYDEAFADLPVTLPAEVPPGSGERHARHLYTLLTDPDRSPVGRDEVLVKLKAMNIGCGVHYLAVHEHGYYRERFGYRSEDFPNAAHVSANTFSVPLSPKLTDKDTDDVIRAVRRVFGAERGPGGG